LTIQSDQSIEFIELANDCLQLSKNKIADGLSFCLVGLSATATQSGL